MEAAQAWQVTKRRVDQLEAEAMRVWEEVPPYLTTQYNLNFLHVSNGAQCELTRHWPLWRILSLPLWRANSRFMYTSAMPDVLG